MTKKAYMKPTMKVVKIQQRACILSTSNNYGLSNSLNSTQVGSAWSRSNKDWSDDEDEE